MLIWLSYQTSSLHFKSVSIKYNYLFKWLTRNLVWCLSCKYPKNRSMRNIKAFLTITIQLWQKPLRLSLVSYNLCIVHVSPHLLRRLANICELMFILWRQTSPSFTTGIRKAIAFPTHYFIDFIRLSQLWRSKTNNGYCYNDSILGSYNVLYSRINQINDFWKHPISFKIKKAKLNIVIECKNSMPLQLYNFFWLLCKRLHYYWGFTNSFIFHFSILFSPLITSYPWRKRT